MPTPLKVLFVEDRAEDAELLVHELEKAGFSVNWKRVERETEYRHALSEELDLIIADYTLPQFSTPRALEILLESNLDLPFIVVSGTIGEERAVGTLKAGATDYVSKLSLHRLGLVVQRARGDASLRKERKRLEQQIRLQATAIETAANSVAITDAAGQFIWVNPSFTALTGFSLEEVRGQNARILKSGRHSREFYRDLWSTVLAGNTWRGEFTNRHKDGSLYFAEQTITPVCSTNGDITHLVGIMQDVTQRKRAETALRTSEETLRQLAESIDDVFWMTSADQSKFVYVSPAYEKVWGRQPADLYTNPRQWIDAVVLEDRPKVLKFHEELAKGKPQAGVEYRIETRAGELRHIADRGFLIRNEKGEVSRHGGLASDVTERKRLELQFLRAQRLESIGTLASGIAHDLNNALAPILMSLEVLRPKLADPESAAMVDVLVTSAQRGADMIKQLLTFSRGIGGGHTVVPVRRLVREMQNVVRQTFPKNIRVEIELARDLWEVTGDVTQLHQVLLNLCVNARDAMPEGGTLRIVGENMEVDEQFASMSRGLKTGPHVALSVADNGTGMSPEIRERIFDPFFTTKSADKGTGLGLSTVESIVKSHGGALSVRTELGKGSEFRVYLPARAVGSATPNRASDAPLPLGKGELILVVDDEEAIRALSKKTLEAFGYHVLTAPDGAQAVALCAREAGRIKLALTDMAMPIMDGAAAIPAMRALDPALKIVACTGDESADRQMAAQRAGADEFIYKPFTAEVMLRTIRSVLDAKSRRESP